MVRETAVKSFDTGAAPFGDAVGVVIAVGSAVSIIWRDNDTDGLQAESNPSVQTMRLFVCERTHGSEAMRRCAFTLSSAHEVRAMPGKGFSGFHGRF